MNVKYELKWTQNALWPFLVCFCSWPVYLAHLAPAPGAHNYAIDPLTCWASSVQPIHLWALQLSEPSQPHRCEWQLVQHHNLSGNEIPTATSQCQTLPYKSPWSWRAIGGWQRCERDQLAFKNNAAWLILVAQYRGWDGGALSAMIATSYSWMYLRQAGLVAKFSCVF